MEFLYSIIWNLVINLLKISSFKNVETVKFFKFLYYKGFSNRDITISYLYMNLPLNFFNELSMSKR